MARTASSKPAPLRGSRTAATPMAFARAVVLAYEHHGEEPGEALQWAQITPAELRRVDARITAAQMEALCGFAMQQLDDEALGWFSRKLPWGSYGMLCRASITSPTLGVALKRWCRHHRLLTDDLLLDLSVDGPLATITLDEQRRFGALREFCLVTSLRYLHGFACWAVDSRIALRDARFPFAAPPHRDVYPVLFPGPVRFDAAQAGFSFDAQDLAMPLRRDERALQSMLQRALPLTVLPYRRDRLLARRVRELLRQDAARLGTADALAQALNLSVRSLHRQLKDEGVGLQALKDEVRRDQACELLLRTDRPVKQVAQAVGFDNDKSFARAFRQWTGKSPREFRS
jgi:AraC-like DNA-binding protein